MGGEGSGGCHTCHLYFHLLFCFNFCMFPGMKSCIIGCTADLKSHENKLDCNELLSLHTQDGSLRT